MLRFIYKYIFLTAMFAYMINAFWKGRQFVTDFAWICSAKIYQ